MKRKGIPLKASTVFASSLTLADLGFPFLLTALAERCRTPMGKARALSRPFLETREQVGTALEVVAEARALAAEPLSLPFGDLPDIAASVALAAKGGQLEPTALAEVTHLLSASLRARELLQERQRALPRLEAISTRLADLPGLCTRLERAIEPAGTLSDEASPDLRGLRERVRKLHRQIKARLEERLGDAGFATNLREGYYSVRHDRYVVPVLASHQREVKGIVHNASQTGQTLFVEPQEFIELGNALAIAESLVLEEEIRILVELSAAVGAKAQEIAVGLQAVGELDEAEGAARLAQQLDAATPVLEEPGGDLELLRLRHPRLVLQGTQVVPNDVRLSAPLRALVLSGPNAGGKTATLTAVGLCAAMARAGLPVPAAAGSRVPLFASLHVTVGDAQDLGQGLSTFSAHLQRLKAILAEASPGALVLVDEIAADTDPREGAALAVSILEDLLQQGSLVMVTTHLDEVKALAHLDPRFQNARVGLDPARGTPSFRLQLGAAGQSSAVDVAERLGIPPHVTARARELLAHVAGPLTRALAALEEERARLQQMQQAAAAEAAGARAERESLERERERTLGEHHLQLKAEFDRTAEELRALLTELRAKPTVRAASSARQEVLERAEAAQAKALATSGLPPQAAPAPLRAGGRARHRGLGQVVEVLEVDGDEALVTAGPMRMRVALSELTGVAGGKGPSAFPSSEGQGARLRANADRVTAQPVESTSQVCDVRGMRADEALRRAERFLDDAYQAGHEGATVLHGHGTGALKQTLRAYLDRSPQVRMFRPGDDREGGDAVTVVAFR